MLELLFLTILILILVLIVIDRVWALRVEAEKTGVETLVGTLRNTLGIELVGHVSRHGIRGLDHYHHSNPIAYLDTAPLNYLGAFPGEPDTATTGHWYYNAKAETLVYHVRFSDYLVNDNHDEPDRLHFQVKMSYRDRNGNGRYDPGLESPTALMLVALDNYSWVSVDHLADAIPEGERENGQNTE